MKKLNLRIMANSFPTRAGVIAAVRFAAALLIVLWPARGWAQGEVNPASQRPVSPTAEDRRSFADAENRRYKKKTTKLFPHAPVDQCSAEGPDATYYVWHMAEGQAAAWECKDYDVGYISKMSKLGFTKLIYKDEKGGGCELDLSTGYVSVPSTPSPTEIVTQKLASHRQSWRLTGFRRGRAFERSRWGGGRFACVEVEVVVLS
jgi:hypothetical protein